MIWDRVCRGRGRASESWRNKHCCEIFPQPIDLISVSLVAQGPSKVRRDFNEGVGLGEFVLKKQAVVIVIVFDIFAVYFAWACFMQNP